MPKISGRNSTTDWQILSQLIIEAMNVVASCISIYSLHKELEVGLPVRDCEMVKPRLAELAARERLHEQATTNAMSFADWCMLIREV